MSRRRLQRHRAGGRSPEASELSRSAHRTAWQSFWRSGADGNHDRAHSTHERTAG